MQSTLPRHDVVLLGAGHTNAHVLRMWRMKPVPDARLTVISNYPVATYSGMLPGVLAGLYPRERMEIDLVRLCAAAGARLIVGDVTGINLEERTVLMAERPAVPFDVLSIGIGSVPKRDGALAAEIVLPIKPMQTFLPRLDDRLHAAAVNLDGRPLQIVIAGGGAGGVEITFCLPAHVRARLGEVRLELTIVQSQDRLVPGVTERTAELVERELVGRGVRILRDRRVTEVHAGKVRLDDGTRLPADLVLWATRATPPPLLTKLGLPKHARGFLLTRPTLQTVADLPIFAVGDTGTIQDSSTPKAGVYAVRQGPILFENIGRLLNGRPLREYVPQKGFLKLLNTGDGRAIGEYRGLTLHGRWCWKLKDAIDSRFMDKYQDYRPMPMKMSTATQEEMRCLGCGGKVSGSVLSRALARLQIPQSEHVVVGLEAPDDAAIIRPPGGRPVTVTVDFFAAPLDDPYLVGRLAALNAASDIFAMGARPLAALAMATLPVGRPRQQEQLLYELLAGSLEEFRRMDTALVGGHTIEGPQLTAGFTLLADQGSRPPRTKGGLRPGDALILTKPLGSGILLAAHMRALCKAEWMERLLETMLLSNQAAAALVDDFDVAAVTDITGFGLAGHLLEMLRASGTAAELHLGAIQLLPGVEELLNHGVQSTLAPANRDSEALIRAAEQIRTTAAYDALFDPQTCGGLLLGVPQERAEAMLGRLKAQSAIPPALIGRIAETAELGTTIVTLP